MASLAEIRARLQAAKNKQGGQSTGGDNSIYPHWNMEEGQDHEHRQRQPEMIQCIRPQSSCGMRKGEYANGPRQGGEQCENQTCFTHCLPG